MADQNKSVTKNIRNTPGPKFIPLEARPASLATTSRSGLFFGVQSAYIWDYNKDANTVTLYVRYPLPGLWEDVQYSSAWSGGSSQSGGIPEIGAQCYYIFMATGTGSGAEPVVMTYPANQRIDEGRKFIKSMRVAYGYPPLNCPPNVTYYKNEETQPGEYCVVTPESAKLSLNKDAYIRSSDNSELRLRSYDRSILSSAVNHYQFSDGVMCSSGPIVRPGADLSGNNIRQMILPNGLDRRIVVPSKNSETNYLKDSTEGQTIIPAYVEHRITVTEQVPGSFDLNPIITGVDVPIKEPLITQSMGTYVGANPNDAAIFGKIVKVRLFDKGTGLPTQGPAFEEVQQTQSKDEADSLALAYALHSHKEGAEYFRGVDKEGHLYEFMPASVNNPLGAGRSASVVGAGSKKESWGPDELGNSWDLSTGGGVKWNLGAHNDKVENGTSLSINAQKGISIKVANGASYSVNGVNRAVAKIEELEGDSVEIINGNKIIQATGTIVFESKAKRMDKFMGVYESHHAADKVVTCQGSETKMIMNSKITTAMNVDETIPNLPVSPQGPMKVSAKSTTVHLGNISESIRFFGNKITTLTLGSKNTLIATGSKSNTIGTGSYSTTVGTGAITLTTGAGAVAVTGTSTTITSTASTLLSAPTTTIASGSTFIGTGALTGVITMGSHMDYITGIPLRSSFTVYAAL